MLLGVLGGAAAGGQEQEEGVHSLSFTCEETGEEEVQEDMHRVKYFYRVATDPEWYNKFLLPNAWAKLSWVMLRSWW